MSVSRCSAALLALLASVAAPVPVNVGNGTQLLFDEAVIASMDGLTRTLNPPSFDRVVLQPGGHDAPWEEGFSLVELGTSIVRIPGTRRLRMYYTLRWGGMDAHGVPLSHSKALPDMYLQAIAESDDVLGFFFVGSAAAEIMIEAARCCVWCGAHPKNIGPWRCPRRSGLVAAALARSRAWRTLAENRTRRRLSELSTR